MTKLTSRLIAHFPFVFAFIVFWAVAALLTPYAVEERGYVATLWHFATGAISGLAIGTGLAWFVGGVGVAAMGTAFAFPVIAVGAALGALLGAGIGSGFTLIRLLSDPSRYEVSPLGLAGVFALAAVLAALAWWLGSMLRSRLSRKVPDNA